MTLRLRPDADTDPSATEDIHLRNYDGDRAHTVWLNVVADGERVFETTRRLPPGGAASVADALEPGEYEIEVGSDGLRRTVGSCRIGDAPDETARIEMGNGVVSITSGL